MNPPPNFNATAPNDVKDYSANYGKPGNAYRTQKKLINATALTPRDYENDDDFHEALLHRLHIAEHFISINKYIDEHLDFAKAHIPPQTL